MRHSFGRDPKNKQVVEIMNSWLEKKRCWGEGFLIWNREKDDVYGDFANAFQSKAKEKGINLIFHDGGDFNPRYHPKYHNPDGDRFSRLFPISFVLFSEDFVASEKCLLQLLAMYKSNMTPTHPIHFYTDSEIQHQPIRFFRFQRFLDIAFNIIKNEHDQEVIRTIFETYFFAFKSDDYDAPPVSPDLPFSTMLLIKYWFPDYDTFFGLDSLAITAFNIINHQQQGGRDDDDVMYLCVMGSNDRYNQFVAHNVSSPHRLASNTLVKHYDMSQYIFPPRSFRPYEQLFGWGLSFALQILKLRFPAAMVKQSHTDYDTYSWIIDNLPKEKCFLLIENIPNYDELKALANTFDFLRPGSRIVFTTTNEDFFLSKKSWHKYHPTNGASLPTLSWFKGQMLDDGELANLKKWHSNSNDVMVTKHEPPTHEEEGALAQKKLRIVEQQEALACR